MTRFSFYFKFLLSAVDQHVGRHIFDKCIKSFFSGKTVLFVTHQLQYLSECDDILVFKNGEIIEQGNLNELLDKNGHIAHLLADDMEKKKKDTQDEPEISINEFTSKNEISKDNEPAKEKINSKRTSYANALSPFQLENRRRLSVITRKSISDTLDDGKLVKHIENYQLKLIGNTTGDPLKTFERNRLSIVSKSLEAEKEEEIPSTNDTQAAKLVLEDQSIYYKEKPIWSYLKAGRGSLVSILIFSLYFIVHAIRLFCDYWLSWWFQKSTGSFSNITNEIFIGVYAGIVVVYFAGILIRGVLFAFNSLNKNVQLHAKMFKSVVFARMSFFDTTPLGRILNAFARHQYALDSQLTDYLMQLLMYTPLCLGAIVLIIVVMYQTIGVFVGAIIVTCMILLFMGSVETKLRNQDSITKSTIYSHLTATLEGLFSIRAYQCEQQFINLYNEKIDTNHTFLFGMMEVKCWLAFYLDVLTSCMVYTTVVIVVELYSSFTDSDCGLVISNILQLLVFFQWTVRMFGEVREKMDSVKQVSYYGNSVLQEAPSIIENNRPPINWPENGNIKFENVYLKYHEFGVFILKGVELNIKPKEKIGIVGRTGSGKSTLLISLLRIVEASEGRLLIDGIDVGKIGLQDLRSKIAIIPQEPILFVGTIRENIDLFQKNTDDEIWQALESVHLANTIRKLDLKLNAPVIENGKNFSVGQRQLFCIARAMLSKTKILVLDEATAAVDLQTDKLIQQSIKNNFNNLTVLTIAHRLNTVMESDKILVMDAGKAVEFAPPLALLKRPNGYFNSLVSQTGEETSKKLKKMAEEKAKSEGLDPNNIYIDDDPDNIAIDPTTGMDTVNRNLPKIQVVLTESCQRIESQVFSSENPRVMLVNEVK